MIEKLRELLSSINDESTLEETRRVILDVIDALDDITKDLDEYQALVDKLTQENADKDYEIARLKEENGRRELRASRKTLRTMWMRSLRHPLRKLSRN